MDYQNRKRKRRRRTRIERTEKKDTESIEDTIYFSSLQYQWMPIQTEQEQEVPTTTRTTAAATTTTYWWLIDTIGGSRRSWRRYCRPTICYMIFLP
jgi:hypothetical protein